MTTLANMSEAQKAEFLAAVSAAIGAGSETQTNELSWLLRYLSGWPRYWGTSTQATLDQAGVFALQNLDVTTTVRTFLSAETTAGAQEYFYYAYPVCLGLHLEYCISTVGPMALGLSSPVVSDINLVDESGASTHYVVLRSQSKMTGKIWFRLS